MKAIGRIPASVALLFWMTALTGVAYPLVMTGLAQVIFPRQANGGLIVIGGEVRGSSLLAQKFEGPRFFKARPSATDYSYLGSGASNLAMTNAAQASVVADRRSAWIAAFGGSEGTEVPEEMLYASGSGLDPDISLESALAQAPSVAVARGLDAVAKAALEASIKKRAASSTSLIGPPRVNVVELNAALETDPSFGGTK